MQRRLLLAGLALFLQQVEEDVEKSSRALKIPPNDRLRRLICTCQIQS